MTECREHDAVSGILSFDGHVYGHSWISQTCSETDILATDPIDTALISIPPVLNPCEDARTLTSKAERCRRLAAGVSDKQTTDVLIGMAQSYEQAAERLQVQLRG